MAIQILDLWQSLVVEVFGSLTLFFMAVLFGILILSAIMKWSNKITMVTLVAVSLMLSFFFNKALAVVLLVALSAIGLAIARFVSRG